MLRFDRNDPDYDGVRMGFTFNTTKDAVKTLFFPIYCAPKSHSILDPIKRALVDRTSI